MVSGPEMKNQLINSYGTVFIISINKAERYKVKKIKIGNILFPPQKIKGITKKYPLWSHCFIPAP